MHLPTLLLLASTTLSANGLSSAGDTLAFSFHTADGTMISVTEDVTKEAVCFRMTIPNDQPLVKCSDTGKNAGGLQHSHYIRGGGKMNEGMDLNYIFFTLDSVKYIVFDNHYAADDSRNTGIRIIDLKSGAVNELPAVTSTIKGELFSFRYHDLLLESAELFD